MADIVIIGGGRLGTCLGRALAGTGHVIRAVTCRRMRSAKESRAIVGQGRAMTDNAAAARLGEVIFLCLPDREIPAVAVKLARSRVSWTGKTVLHSSGFLTSEALGPLKEKGALAASVHPAQAFADRKTPPSHFRGILFAVEGDKPALALAKGFIRQLGAKAVVIPAEAKPLYHAALAFASNFFVILMDAAARLLDQAGISKKEAVSMLFPLVEGTLRNVKELDAARSLTGPLARGDADTVSAHLEALRSMPQVKEAYRTLSRMGVEMARRAGLPPSRVKALKSRLGGK